MSSRAGKSLGWVLMAAALLAPAATARAAEKTPIQPLGITQWGGDLLLRGNLQSRTEQTRGGQPDTESEKFFEETLSLRGAGYIYHPNLLEWFGDIRAGLVQESITTNNQTSSGPGQVKGYNISGLFLREKPVSAMLFSSNMQEFINRDFASSTNLKNTRDGGQIMLKGDVPMTLMFEKVTVDELSNLRSDFRKTQHTRLTASQQHFKDLNLDFTYDHEDTDETTVFTPLQGGQSTTDYVRYKRDEANLNSLLKFGDPDHMSQLGLNGHTLQRLGTYPDRIRSGDFLLDLAHTKSFSTFYRGMYDQDQTESDLDREANGEMGFRQKVYDSLDITGRVNGMKHSFEGGQRDAIGKFLDLGYRKETPIGQYTSNVTVGEQDSREVTLNGQENIRGENVTMAGLLVFVPLQRPGIITGSIVVQNLARTITYVLGVDYNLQTIGQVTSIEPLVAGGIGPAQTVLVDYAVIAAKNAEWTTDFSTWNNRLQLANNIPFAIYYNFNRQADHLTRGEDPGNLDINTDRLAGIQFDKWGLTVTGEHETRDQDLSPSTTADRIRALYIMRLARDVDLSVGGGDEHLLYRNAAQFNIQPGRDKLDTLQGYARMTVRLQRNTLLHVD
ncbi:MAG: hypothetical protein NT049_05780, partial [Planctomycetota bacterium]|nr:hypothetical protein [Planctomycetota bacterium]